MQNNLLLILILIGHFLGDYYFQSNNLATKKRSNVHKLLQHCTIYFLCMLLVLIPFLKMNYFVLILEVSLVHLVIDFLKYKIEKNKVLNHKQELSSYLIDQLLHVITIILIIYYNNAFIAIKSLGIVIVLAVLIIEKPCSVTIDKILKIYRPIDKPLKTNNAGILIGGLERAIILILLFYQQFGTIGLVLAAKSIARYSEMANNKNFAEYYLMGTLLSIFLVMLTYLLLFSNIF